MANLIVRNIDESIVNALKERASQHGVSAEAEHRKILEEVLIQPQRKSFAEVLRLIPNVGNDLDFERVQDDSQDDSAGNVFD
jgi:antitoxin FitA